MHPDKQKIYKSLAIILGLAILVTCITQISKRNSLTLSEYETAHPELAETRENLIEETPPEEAAVDANPPLWDTDIAADSLQDASTIADSLHDDTDVPSSVLIGAALNGDSMTDDRVTYADSFYYEPLSDNLRRYITGISFPADSDSAQNIAVSYDDLRYVHVLYCDLDGNPAEGELICNDYITQDIVEIFYELYNNEYRIEKIRLIDEYDGDDTVSMEDNNTSCFNYRTVPDSTNLSKHALGLAVDVNPLYNPYITYNTDGTENISPVSAVAYADRNAAFPYKIDENDLCYKLFKQHGFTWGGNWNSCKDYQHFQKVPK